MCLWALPALFLGRLQAGGVRCVVLDGDAESGRMRGEESWGNSQLGSRCERQRESLVLGV